MFYFERKSAKSFSQPERPLVPYFQKPYLDQSPAYERTEPLKTWLVDKLDYQIQYEYSQITSVKRSLSTEAFHHVQTAWQLYTT